jgi:hypothetical protein
VFKSIKSNFRKISSSTSTTMSENRTPSPTTSEVLANSQLQEQIEEKCLALLEEEQNYMIVAEEMRKRWKVEAAACKAAEEEAAQKAEEDRKAMEIMASTTKQEGKRKAGDKVGGADVSKKKKAKAVVENAVAGPSGAEAVQITASMPCTR